MNKLLSKIKRWWCGPTKIYKTLTIHKFDPKGDITSFEVAQVFTYPRLFTNEYQMKKWWEGVPDNVKRHYTDVDKECFVGYE